MRTGKLCRGPLFFVVAAVGLGGCLGGASAPSKFYTLAPVASRAAESNPASPGFALGIGPVTLPGYLDRPQIVTRKGPDEIELAEFDRWAEPLKDSVPRILGENMAAQLQTDRVVLFPRQGSQVVQNRVAVDVIHFEGAAGADVALDARWRILGSDGKELASRRSILREPTGAPGYAPLAAAMSRVLGRLSQDIATTLKELPR
jgi:uncharacterized lipoprotein YmbA